MRWLLVLALLGCSSEEPDPPASLTEKQCNDGGKLYQLGQTWACADGCNTCKCGEQGVESTLMACDAAPPFNVDSSTPADAFPPPDTASSDASDASGG